jgi:hypothetical protein
MTPAARAAGYDHRLAIGQLEVSLTPVFDRPLQGRPFFEAVIRENLHLDAEIQTLHEEAAIAA